MPGSVDGPRAFASDSGASGATPPSGESTSWTSSAAPPDEVFDRILAIEATSWKGHEGTGLASTELAGFYRQMTVRLAARDHLRVLIAHLDGHDLGFVLGGIRGDGYRGLQLSFHRDHGAFGLGHVLQAEQLERLVGEGVHRYDLGMDMPYKRRWADTVDETFSLIIRR